MRMLPFTVFASTSPVRSAAPTSPLTVLPAAVAGVHGADRDAILVLHDLDLHLVGVAPTRVFHGGHLDVARAGDGADVAVHALDFDRFARSDFALPVEFALAGGGPGDQSQASRAGEQRG